MNILIAVPWDQRSGGVASVVGNLGRYLKSRGHNVYFFHPARSAVLLRRGITLWGFRGFKLRLGSPFPPVRPVLSTLGFAVLFPFSLFQLIALIVKKKIDVVNVHYPTGEFVFFALCRKVLPIKLVSSIHGADIFPKGQPSKRYRAFLKFLLKSSDLIVANSNAYRKDFLTLFPALEKKTIAIHNGVDLDKLNEPVRQGYHKNGRRYLLSVATHNEKKGLDVLIRAFSQITQDDPKLELLLVGGGRLRAKHEQLAKSLALQERVRFLGRKDHSEVAKLLHGCELFVHPAISEPFGIAVVEALACRKPVVASDTGGIPEIIQNGRNGILVNPEKPEALAEAVRSVLADPDLQRKLAQNGYETVAKHFLHTKTGQQYETALSVLISRA